MEAEAEKFFSMEQNFKQKLIVPDNDNKGFFVPNKGDFKEYYHLDRNIKNVVDTNFVGNVSEQDALHGHNLRMGQPDFVKEALSFYDTGVQMGQAVMGALEQKFNLRAGTLVGQTQSGNHIARFLNYFAQDKITAEELSGKTRAKAHTDICALTFLLPSKVKGLQVLAKQDLATAFGTKETLRSNKREWVDVPYIENTLICNIGQSLSIKLNGALPPTVHRVRNPSVEDAMNPRIAMPFFFHFDENISLNPFEEMVKRNKGINLFQNAKNIILKQYVDADSEFHPNRAVCSPNEHASKFLKEQRLAA